MESKAIMENSKQQSLFNEVLESHKGIIYKIAKSYCFDATDRQDLIQEILIKIWQALPSYNSDYALTTWIYRISLNTAISHYRKEKVQEKYFISLEPNFEVGGIEISNEKEQDLALLEKFIGDLKEIDKALMLLFLEDKSHAEISEILGISVSNVSTKIARIKEKLKNRFTLKNK